MQNDFQIVNHQIEHNPDLGAAIWIRREAMCFDETRMGQALFQRAEDGIKAFNMANLQNQPFFRRELCEFARVGGIFGDWFFDEQMFAAHKQITRDRKMRASGGSD